MNRMGNARFDERPGSTEPPDLTLYKYPSGREHGIHEGPLGNEAIQCAADAADATSP